MVHIRVWRTVILVSSDDMGKKESTGITESPVLGHTTLCNNGFLELQIRTQALCGHLA